MPWKPDYVTTEEAAGYIRVDDAIDDDAIARAVAAASRAVDRHTGRQFGQVPAPEARYYTAHWSRAKSAWTLLVDDFHSTAGMLIHFDTANNGTYSTAVPLGSSLLYPLTAAQEDRPWERIVFRGVATAVDGRPAGFRVTAPWGWATVPVAVQEAVLLQTSRLHARRDAPFGVAGSPADGSEIRLLAKLDPDLVTSLADYNRRMWAR